MEALTPASETSRRTEVMALPAALRPATGAGVPLSTLAAQVGAVPAEGSSASDLPITGVTLRAQDVQPGDLFAALPGGATHGARFYGDAIERGAVAVLTDASGLAQLNRDAGVVPVLVHPEPRSVLGELAATVYGHPSERLAVIGVTGTSGKTTTTYLIEAGLRSAGRTVGLIGTVGLRINGVDIPSALTTPEAPALQALLAVMAERGVDTVVMEVSSHALTLGRVDGIHFAVGGFTNLSRDHLDFHPTMEDYFEAKARLFDPASPLHARRAVVCVDDDAGRSMAHRADKVTTVSTKGRPADWRAEGVTAEARRAGVHRRRPGRCAPPVEDCAAWRLQHRQLPCRTGGSRRGRGFPRAGVNWTPAHPGSRTARADRPRPELPGLGRLRAQAGRAAGGFADPAPPRPAGWRWCSAPAAIAIRVNVRRWAASPPSWPTSVVVTDDNPRSEDPASIRREILSGATEADAAAHVVEIGDRREAIDHAVAWARAGDVVLIAGKGHETGQTSAGQTRPFDDRVELAAALRGAAR